MFAAKALTVPLAICLFLVHAEVSVKQMTAVSAQKGAHSKATQIHAQGLSDLDFLQQLLTKPLPERTITQATLATLSLWTRTAKDYGITINESASTTGVGGSQSVLPIKNLQYEIEPGVEVQSVVIKGQYHSLEALLQFVSEQVHSQYCSVSKATLYGTNFEMTVEIYARKEA